VGEAVVEFDSALARDAHYALAMSGSADAHLFLKNADPANAKHHLDAARRLALQAVQTDPSLAEGHNSLAAVRQAEWRWQDAEMSYREALRLKPGLAKAHRWFCGLTLQFGRTDEALVHARRAIELDPYDRALPATIGLYYFLAGNNKQALELLEPAVRELDIVGRSGSARFNLAQVYARMGYLASGVEARAHFTKAIEQATIMKSLEASGTAAPPSLAGQLFALIHSLRGEPGEAEPFFAPMLIEYARGNIPALHMAWVYAAQRKIDEAIAVLDRGLTVHDPTLLYIKVVPFLENLRHDQRFLTIVQRMNL
jgi:tetratricopeptide (TPR) repeat protein